MDKMTLRNDFYENYAEETCFSWTVSKIISVKNMGFPVQNGQNFGFWYPLEFYPPLDSP